MSALDRKEDEVRRLLEAAPRPTVPQWLPQQAAAYGLRRLRRRRLVQSVCWWLLLVAVVAFTVWAVRTEPWAPPPLDTTPPLKGW